jgi:pSer/pThr/pTyr-binding forkhead associated (FHA) protein
MPSLKLNFKNKTLENFPLRKGYSLSIGRKRNNDIIIENLAVSSHHAKIDSVGDEFVLIDLQSKNGTFVNEKLITSHWLKTGDVINIGKHILVFNFADDEKWPDDETDEIERTMVMDTSKYRSMVDNSMPQADNSRASANRIDTIAILSFLSGGSAKFKCRKSITKIGKHRDSDIVVKGFLVGRTSATISKRPDGFYLNYVGGLSRPKVNAKKVQSERRLYDNDIIEIGTATMQFFERKPRKRKEKIPKETQPITQNAAN